jgi:hypothetical protein
MSSKTPSLNGRAGRFSIKEETESLEVVSCPVDKINCDEEAIQSLRDDLEVIFRSRKIAPPMGIENKTGYIEINGIKIHYFFGDITEEIAAVLSGERKNIKESSKMRQAALELRKYWEEQGISIPS